MNSRPLRYACHSTRRQLFEYFLSFLKILPVDSARAEFVIFDCALKHCIGLPKIGGLWA
jgi:hypothetical protein